MSKAIAQAIQSFPPFFGCLFFTIKIEKREFYMVEQRHGDRTATLRDALRNLAGQETDIETLVGKTGLSPAAVRNYVYDHPGEVEKRGKGKKQRLFIHDHVDETSFTGPGIRISPAPGFDVGGNDRGVSSSRGRRRWRHRLSE